MGNYLFAFFFIALGVYLSMARKIPFIKEPEGIKNLNRYCLVNGIGLCAIGLVMIIGTALGWSSLLIGMAIVIGCVGILVAEVYTRCI
ncbi:hypothetical protein BN3662_00955 [Clostridiales bacterium CHKCI006]|nr:hypothetical protein BN3662_00955 [Clostridiales bacterium CHKCI006]